MGLGAQAYPPLLREVPPSPQEGEQKLLWDAYAELERWPETGLLRAESMIAMLDEYGVSGFDQRRWVRSLWRSLNRLEQDHVEPREV